MYYNIDEPLETMLSERSKSATKGPILHDSTNSNVQNRQICRHKGNEASGCQGMKGLGKLGVTANRNGVPLFGVMRIFYN